MGKTTAFWPRDSFAVFRVPVSCNFQQQQHPLKKITELYLIKNLNIYIDGNAKTIQ